MTHADGVIKNAWKRSTRVMWSRTPNGKAIVFVHGFKGGYTTWDGFPSRILKEPSLDGYDIFFVEYEWADRAILTGSALKDFFDSLFNSPDKYFGNEFTRLNRQATPYTELTIVAHSLGAIVTRFALLDAQALGLSWINSTKMLLFAPAHLGADIITLGTDALGVLGLFGVTAPALKIKYPSLIDLEHITTNTTLDSLRTKSQNLLNAGNGQFTIAKVVLFGTADKVVVPGQFCSDPPLRAIPSIGHTGICKPTPTFDEPFQTLITYL